MFGKELFATVESPFDLAPQSGQESRHRGENGDALVHDRLENRLGMDRIHERDRAAEEVARVAVAGLQLAALAPDVVLQALRAAVVAAEGVHRAASFVVVRRAYQDVLVVGVEREAELVAGDAVIGAQDLQLHLTEGQERTRDQYPKSTYDKHLSTFR